MYEMYEYCYIIRKNERASLLISDSYLFRSKNSIAPICIHILNIFFKKERDHTKYLYFICVFMCSMYVHNVHTLIKYKLPFLAIMIGTEN